MTAAIPPNLDVGPNYTLQFTALNPTTGAVDTNVVITSAFLIAANVRGVDLEAAFKVGDIEWLHLPDLEAS